MAGFAIFSFDLQVSFRFLNKYKWYLSATSLWIRCNSIEKDLRILQILTSADKASMMMCGEKGSLGYPKFANLHNVFLLCVESLIQPEDQRLVNKTKVLSFTIAFAENLFFPIFRLQSALFSQSSNEYKLVLFGIQFIVQFTMNNGNSASIHLNETRFHTPLFISAIKAVSSYSENLIQPAKYLIIDSSLKINEKILQQCPSICPIYNNATRTFIVIEGNVCGITFAQKIIRFCFDGAINLVYAELYHPRSLVLRKYGYEHPHLKEYAIRRVNSHQFKLIYHPEMVDQMECAKSNVVKWDHLYFSPEQLSGSRRNINSNVFSLGALVLNIMNPLDFNRSIYQKNEYKIDKIIINQKLRNASQIYSEDLIRLLQYCLIEDESKRITLEILYEELCSNKQMAKRQKFIDQIKDRVMIESKVSSKSKDHHKADFQHKLIQSHKKPKFQTPLQKKKPVLEQKMKSSSTSTPKTQYKKEEESNTQETSSKSTEIYIPFHRGTFGGQYPITEQQQQNEKSSVQIPFAHKGQILIQQNESSTSQMSDNSSLEVKQKKNFVLTDFQLGQENEIEDIISPKGFGQKVEFPSTIEKLDQSHKQQQVHQEHIQQIPQQHLPGQQNIRKYRQVTTLTLEMCLRPVNQIVQLIGRTGVWIQGDIYFGEFKNGRRIGLGLEIFPENQYYFGYFVDDLFHGEGFYFWSNKEHFLGTFENGQKTYGTLYGPRCKYTGRFKHSKRHGYGQCVYVDGSIYDGEWQQGKRHGSGTMIQVTGDKFIGTYKNGKKYGKGSYYTQNSTIHAIWIDDFVAGEAQIQYKSGTYSGSVDDSFQKHGYGEFKFKSGSSYVGTFQANEFVYGQIVYKNGQRYVGDVKDNLRHGQGQYFYNNRTTWKGKWIKNQKIEEEKATKQ